MMMHHDTEQQEDVYQCVGCASLWSEDGIARRWVNDQWERYCRGCSSNVRLCSDEGDCDKE